MLVSRNDSVAYYSSKLNAAQKKGTIENSCYDILFPLVSLLPPYLCLQVENECHDFASYADKYFNESYGQEKHSEPLVAEFTIHKPSEINTNLKFNHDLLKLVELNNYIAIDFTPEELGKMRLALDELKLYSISTYDHIKDFSSTLVKVTYMTSNSAKLIAEFSSCSFFQLPFTTFISEYAFRHVPPNSIFSQSFLYPIQESLFHESLHHRLHETFRQKQLLKNNLRAFTPTIKVPWRNSVWTLEHAIHAFLVYVNVLNLRIQYFKFKNEESNFEYNDDIQALRKSIVSAVTSSALLGQSIMNAKMHLSSDGYQLVMDLWDKYILDVKSNGYLWK